MCLETKPDHVPGRNSAADCAILDNQAIDSSVSSAARGSAANIAEWCVAVLYDINLVLNLLLLFRVSLRVNGVLIGIVLISVALIWIGLTRIGLVPIALISPVRTRILLIVEIRTHQLYVEVLRHPVADSLPTSWHIS